MIDIMNANDINILLQLGERITFECKKLKDRYLNQYGKHILHLPIR